MVGLAILSGETCTSMLNLHTLSSIENNDKHGIVRSLVGGSC